MNDFKKSGLERAACVGGINMSSAESVIGNKMEFDQEDFLLQTMPVGIIVMNDKLDIAYRNKEGNKFLKRYGLPGEVPRIGAGYLRHFNHPA